MAKQSMEWHKQCLKNRYASVGEKKKKLAWLMAEVDRDEKENTFYHLQIHEADKQGKDGFNADLFMKKQRHHYIF